MTREERLAQAGDYVLGLMDESQRAAFEAAMADDAELLAAVDRLTRQMASLDDTATPVTASRDLWSKIENRLAEMPKHAASTPPPARRPVLQNWYAMAASVIVALGLGYAAGNVLRTPPEPTVIAVLLNQTDASPAVIVEAFADDSVHLVPLDNFEVPEGKILQVWTLPDPETGPVSLGTLTASQDIRLAGPNLPLPQNGQLYEITLEPAPGSPTGRPTGPILVKGFAKPPV